MGQPLTLSIVLDADNKGLVGSVRVSKKELDKLNGAIDHTGDSSQQTRTKMGKLEQQTKVVSATSREASQSVGSLTSSFGGLKGMLAGLGIGVVLGEMATGIDTIQGMEAQLKTITGDWASANVELERLIGFAKQTPYDLKQSVEAFTKLTHLGLNPSERAMKSYGNTASAMGKDLMQMIEAVADASVGEFERLKEFGIKASQQGDKVRLTFQGNTTEIKKDAQSIQDYLMALGENEFAGAMEDQMNRLSAKTSNFKMELLQLADAMGDAGLTTAFGTAIDGGSEMVSLLTQLIANGEIVEDTLLALSVIVGARLTGSFVTLAGVGIAKFNKNMLMATVKTNAFGQVVSKTTAKMRMMNTAAIASRGALALIGGPVGAAVLAGYALYKMSDGLAEVKTEAEYLEQAVGDVTKSIRQMTLAEQESTAVEYEKLIKEKTRNLKELQRQIDETKRRAQQSSIGGNVLFSADETKVAIDTGKLSQQEQEVRALKMAVMELKNAMFEAGMANIAWDNSLSSDKLEGTTSDLFDLYNKYEQLAGGIGKTGAALELFNLEFEKTTELPDDAKEKILGYAKAVEDAKATLNFDKYIAGLAQGNELLAVKLKHGEQEYRIQLALSKFKNLSDENATSIRAEIEAQAALNDELKEQEDLKNSIKDFDSLIEDVESYGDAWAQAGNVIVDTFGRIGQQLEKLNDDQENYIKLKEKLTDERDKFKATGMLQEEAKAIDALAKLDSKRTQQTIGDFAAISGAASQMFDEQSKGREALHQMEQAFTIIEVGLAMQKAGANAIAAITSAFEAPWPIGFASGAAMMAIMAGLGVFSGSSGTAPPSSATRQASQGTGTVLGSDEKSASLSNAYERLEDLELDQYAELQQMNASLRDLNSNITHLATNLVMQYGRFDGDSYGGFLGTKDRIDTGGFFEKVFGLGIFSDPLGGLLDSLIGSFKKTKVSLLDSGLSFGSQSLGDMFAAGSADLSTYNDIKTKKSKWWGATSKTTYSTEYGAVDNEVATEVARIFESIGTSAVSAVELLGVDVAHSLESFVIDLPNLSFKDLSGEEIQQELEAIFSQQGDMIAKWLVPSMKENQQIGEGLYDTLIRVAQEQAVFNSALEQSGLALSRFGGISSETQIAISQSIVGLLGGIEEFRSATSAYFTEFFSEAEQFDYLQQQLTAQFAELGRQVPQDTAAFRALVESLDLITEHGQQTYAALMRLAPAAADYYEQLEQQADTVKQLADEMENALVRQAESIKQLTRDINSTLAQILGGSELSNLIAAEQQRMREQQAAADALYRTEMQRYDQSIAAQRTMMDYLNNLQLGDLSTLTPEQQLAEAQRQFNTVMSAAKSGDIDAANSATGIASSFLTIARDFYSSSDAYSSIFVDVNKQLLTVAGLMGDAAEPAANAVEESAELQSLRAQLADEQAAAVTAKNEQLAQLLGQQLGELALAKDESILSLIDSMGIDLLAVSDSLGIDIGDMSSANIDGLSSLATVLGLDLLSLTTALGVNLTGLAETFGIDLNAVNADLADGITAMAEALDTSSIELAEVLWGGLEELADTFGVSITDFSTDMAGNLESMADVLGVSIETLAEALDIELAVEVPEPTITTPLVTIPTFGDLSGLSDIPFGWESSATTDNDFGGNLPSFDLNFGDFDFSGLDLGMGNWTSGWGDVSWDFSSLGTFAKGGIATEASIFGEAGPEAAVPLPDGRTIPVTFTNPNKSTSDTLLLEEIRALRQEVSYLREDNTRIAESAALQRDEQRHSIVDSGNRTTNALKVPINTRNVA